MIKKRSSKIIIYFLLISGSLAVLMPFIWMLSTSLKKLSHVFRFPPEFIPDPIVWSNYPDALTQIPFGLYFKNSILVTGGCLLGELIVSAIVAYSFARLHWKGRDFLLIIVLSTMMLPRQVTLIPEFIIFKE